MAVIPMVSDWRMAPQINAAGILLTGLVSLILGGLMLAACRSGLLLTTTVLIAVGVVALGFSASWSPSRMAALVLGVGLSVGTRVKVTGVDFDIVEFVLMAALIILVILNLDHLSLPLQIYEVLFLAFLIFRAVTAVFSTDVRHALSDLREWLEFLAALLILRRILMVPNLLSIARKALLIGAVISAGMALGQAYLGWPAPFLSEQGQLKTFIDFSSEAVYRVQPVAAFQSHPNGFAIYLAVSALLLIFWREETPNRRNQLIAWAGAGLCLWAIGTTYAKTTYVAMGLTLLAIPFLRFWRRSLWRTIVLLAVGFGVIFVVLQAAEIGGYEFALSSFRIREKLWSDSFDILASSWSGLLFGDQLPALGMASVWGQPHNTPLVLLLEYGLTGFVFLFVGSWVMGRQLFRRGEAAGEEHQIVSSAKLPSALVLYLGWTGMFESVGYPVHDKIFLAIVAALLLAGQATMNRSAEAGIVPPGGD